MHSIQILHKAELLK